MMGGRDGGTEREKGEREGKGIWNGRRNGTGNRTYG